MRINVDNSNDLVLELRLNRASFLLYSKNRKIFSSFNGYRKETNMMGILVGIFAAITAVVVYVLLAALSLLPYVIAGAILIWIIKKVFKKA